MTCWQQAAFEKWSMVGTDEQPYEDEWSWEKMEVLLTEAGHKTAYDVEDSDKSVSVNMIIIMNRNLMSKQQFIMIFRQQGHDISN